MKIFLRILFFFFLVTQICFAQGYWTKVGDMPEIRYAHTANEINGKIYIVGGLNTEAGAFPTTALVYDRSSRGWTQIPLINGEPQVMHTSCVVDGKLYIVGGYTFNSNTFAKMVMFDPNTGEWEPKAPMPTPRYNLSCAAIDGKIYVVGGMEEMGYVQLKKMEVYDIATDTWTQLTDMPTGRWGLRAIAFDGKIDVFGGTRGTAGFAYASVEVYDPQTNTWTTKSNMPTPRYQLTTCIMDSNIYAIGGWYDSGSGPIYNKVEIYNPTNDTWLTENPLPVARALLANVVLDGKIYVYGGSRTNHPLIGTSAIYEFSREDIFALQPLVDKVYARENIDSVLFITRFSNLNNHSFTPHLIYSKLDSTEMDSITLFDDGLHGDSLSNDGLYGAYIPPRQNEDFFILSVGTIDNQTNKYYNTPDRCRFTTAGPLVVDSVFSVHFPATKSFSTKPYLTNLGNLLAITGVSLKIICNDPWIINFPGVTVSFPTIQPEATSISNSVVTMRYDSTNFPGYFNLKFEIMSGGYCYWKDSLKFEPVIVGLEEHATDLPTEFLLLQNYPNPFNSSSEIKYSIPKSSQVSLKIFNTLGEQIAILVNEEKPVGTYEVEWSAEQLPSGVYFYRLQAGDFIQTRKMILLK
jgi:N-acetylneuraminic acid mutarotase